MIILMLYYQILHMHMNVYYIISDCMQIWTIIFKYINMQISYVNIKLSKVLYTTTQ